MSIIVAISLLGFTILIGVFLTGLFIEDRDVQGTAVLLCVIWLILHAAFQFGAEWQREDFKAQQSIESQP